MIKYTIIYTKKGKNVWVTKETKSTLRTKRVMRDGKAIKG